MKFPSTMAGSKRSRFSLIGTCLALLSSIASAQRPASASLCDYYAIQRFGSNTSETQQSLVKHIVVLAFEGGSGLTNKSTDSTGILRPGRFDGEDVNLLQYFNGSRASTNVNNAPIGINWLDGGGFDPLSAYLTGQTADVVLPEGSNQAHLFGNFFVAFSRAFGCTVPFPPVQATSGPVNLAYAHKFMDLNHTQLGYFINQLTTASQYYGFSSQDASTLNARLNSVYNVRCSPPVTFSPTSPSQLLSLCQHETCPLAVPVSDCAAYDNLQPNGVQNSNPTTVRTTATASVTVVGDAPPPSNDSNSLSTGAIAGIAIGGAAVILMAGIALLFFFKRRRRTPPPTPVTPAMASVTTAPAPHPSPGWDHSQMSSPTPVPQSPSNDPTSPYTVKGSHVSYYSTGGPPSELDNIGYQGRDSVNGMQGPDMGLHPGYRPQWQQPGWMPPVEMDAEPAVARPEPLQVQPQRGQGQTFEGQTFEANSNQEPPQQQQYGPGNQHYDGREYR